MCARPQVALCALLAVGIPGVSAAAFGMPKWTSPAALRIPLALGATRDVHYRRLTSGAIAQSLDRILAVVSGHVIMLSDVRAFLELGLTDVDPTADDADGLTLERLIERRLVLDEVDRYRVPPPPPARIDREVASLRRRSASPDAFTATLNRVGLTLGDLRRILGDEGRREAYLAERFGAATRFTERQLRQYYEEHTAEFTLDGRPLTFAEARAELRERLAAARRRVLVADWVDSLSRRGDVVRFEH